MKIVLDLPCLALVSDLHKSGRSIKIALHSFIVDFTASFLGDLLSWL